MLRDFVVWTGLRLLFGGCSSGCSSRFTGCGGEGTCGGRGG